MKSTSLPTIRIGISRCLLGDQVRFDGGHKQDPFLTGTLGNYFEWVPVCPEVEIGLGTPRESLRLIQSPHGIKMIGIQSGNDITSVMNDYAHLRIKELQRLGLHGYIFKKDSPSCGMERVKVYNASGVAERKGRGLFADAFMERLSLIPVEEEGRLHDLRIRENFIERIFAYHRWTHFIGNAPGPGKLVEFHKQHKFTILSHSRVHYQKLGQFTAAAGKGNFKEVIAQYASVFMEALKVKATIKKHSNVLYHILGFLKSHLSADEKNELVAQIEEYRKELVPLVVPLVLFRHHLRGHPVDWVLEQTYLNPYPAELMLRNHV